MTERCGIDAIDEMADEMAGLRLEALVALHGEEGEKAIEAAVVCGSNEERVADEYAREDHLVRSFRKIAAHACGKGDYPAFFSAASLCARAMNRRAALVEC